MTYKENFALKNLSTFGIGGPAQYLFIVKSDIELFEAIGFAQECHVKPFIFGGGSNLLFPDEGLPTVVIKMQTKKIELTNSELYCDAGVSWIEVARFCKENNLFGLESFYGLPGTVGGAVYGNAGCHGLEIKDIILNAKILNLNTQQVTEIQKTEIHFEYRHSSFKDDANLIVLGATFKVSTNQTDQSGNADEFATERKVKQPTGLTTGSFFKNPKPNFAGQLIEEAGLKGFTLNGRIQTSPKHANFFINTGAATAQDVIELKDKIIETVEQKSSITLEPEVQIIKSQGWQLD